MSTDDHVKAQLTPAGKFALLLIACEIVVFAIALFFGQPELGLSACISISILLIALRATWKLHEQGWYWAAVALSVALQIPFFLYVSWTDHDYRGTALAAFGFLDFIIIWGGITLCGRLLNRV